MIRPANVRPGKGLHTAHLALGARAACRHRNAAVLLPAETFAAAPCRCSRCFTALRRIKINNAWSRK